MRKRETNMATEKIYITLARQIFDNVQANTCQCLWGKAQIECSRLWREIKKGKKNAATKSEAQKLMLQRKMNVKKPGKGSFVNFCIKVSTKTDELVVNML